jgi:hypothetical protein
MFPQRNKGNRENIQDIKLTKSAEFLNFYIPGDQYSFLSSPNRNARFSIEAILRQAS